MSDNASTHSSSSGANPPATTAATRKGLSALLHRGASSQRIKTESGAGSVAAQHAAPTDAGASSEAPVGGHAAGTLGTNVTEQANAPLARLRVQIISGHKLLGRDRNGKSDPYVVLSIPGLTNNSMHNNTPSGKRQTPAISRTVDPVWPASEATFDFDITPAWFGEAGPEGLLTARPVAKRSFSGAAGGAGRYLWQSARKIPKGAAAGARVVGRKAPRPMRIRRGGRTQPSRQSSSEPSDKAAAATDKTTRSSPSPPEPATPESERSGRPRLLRLQTQNNAGGNVSPPQGSAGLNPSGSTHVLAVSALEFVLWDKDRFSANDYLGECSLPVDSWLSSVAADASAGDEEKLGNIAWEKAQPVTLPVVSHRRRREVSGELVVKVGLLPIDSSSTDTATPSALPIEEVYQRLLIANAGDAGGVRSVPADQSLGTTAAAEAFIDDGLSSDSEEEEEVLLSDDEDGKREGDGDGDDASDTDGDVTTDGEDIYSMHYHSIAGVPSTEGKDKASSPEQSLAPIQARPMESPSPPAGGQLPLPTVSGTATAPASGTTTPSINAARRVFFARRSSKNSSSVSLASDGSLQGAAPTAAGGKTAKTGKRRVRRRVKSSKEEFAFKAEMGMDIIGIVMMEVKSAVDLPRWKNGG